jgi:hypothetical protein
MASMLFLEAFMRFVKWKKKGITLQHATARQQNAFFDKKSSKPGIHDQPTTRRKTSFHAMRN